MPHARITSKQLARFSDPFEMPAYGIRDAALYLQLPPATLASWVMGRPYKTNAGEQFFPPVIALPDESIRLLSFYNLAEAHVLAAFRRHHKIDLQHIRSALDFVSARFGHKRPLIEQKFETDGVKLFIEHLGNVIDASAGGQFVMHTVKAYFKRLDWANETVVRFWPFTRSEIDDSPRRVFIDPRTSFGRPSLIKCNVPTAEIAARFKAGETVESLADDFGCDAFDINEALRCEIGRLAA
jgi:uncharacterized protein (DUF433 family)